MSNQEIENVLKMLEILDADEPDDYLPELGAYEAHIILKYIRLLEKNVKDLENIIKSQ